MRGSTPIPWEAKLVSIFRHLISRKSKSVVIAGKKILLQRTVFCTPV